MRVRSMENTSQPRKANFLRMIDVQRRTGLGVSSIYYLRSKGTFPKPVKLGKRVSGWVESEIDAWAEQRIADRAAADLDVDATPPAAA